MRYYLNDSGLEHTLIHTNYIAHTPSTALIEYYVEIGGHDGFKFHVETITLSIIMRLNYISC